MLKNIVQEIAIGLAVGTVLFWIPALAWVAWVNP